MKNVLSVDVEDYFHVQAFASSIDQEDWDRLPSRVEKNVNLVLELLDRHSTKATFFILGWVAERHPNLIRQIAYARHEIGCHGYAHQRLHQLKPKRFRSDIRMAKQFIEDTVQTSVQAYRAPSFSIVTRTLWALDILAEEGFLFDSSIFPVRHDLYGIPGAQRFPHWRNLSRGLSIFEFPPSTVRVGSLNLGVGGGGYLRFAPYGLTRLALREINEKEGQPFMVYFHPWELDKDQPRVKTGVRSSIRHYTNLSTMEFKLKRLLRDFRFTTLSRVCRNLDSFTSASVSVHPSPELFCETHHV